MARVSLVWLAAAAAVLAQPARTPVFQRGVCFTAERGVRYGSEESKKMLRALPAYGVNSVALVPYGFVQRNPMQLLPAGPRSWESEDGVEALAVLARQLGMKVMLKPHLWRLRDGELDNPQSRSGFLSAYGGFAEHYARMAVRIRADFFSIGTELAPSTRDEAAWRAIIARVRAIYKGPLTYSAIQGPEFETIGFWDALDYIGLDNYYPLGDGYSAADALARIEKVQRRFRKPVVFTEAGFSSAVGARKAPWMDETANPVSLEEQLRCYRALLEAFYRKPWFYGVYWWKIGTNGYGGKENNSMTPWGKPAMEEVGKWYRQGSR